jgi:hypothetical protein
MKNGAEQEAIVKRILSELFDPTGHFSNEFDLSRLFSSKTSREEAARTINQQAGRLHEELGGGWFAGVITETELQRVRTGADLMDLVRRHVNGELEDDTWSAF